MVELVSRRRFDVPKLGRFWDAGWPWNIQEGFRLFRCCYFNWKFTEFHRLGPGWAGNLYGILLDPSIPPNNPIDYQPEDGATKLSNENSAIWNRWNRAFTGFQHGIQWVEMGWNGLKYGSYPLQITPLRTLFRSAFKCRMAPKICASFEIRIGPTWSNCQKMSKAWIVFKICLNVSSRKYWSMILDVFCFIIFSVLTRYVWFEIWWSLVGKLPASQEDPTTMFEARQAGLFRKLAGGNVNYTISK